MDLQTETTVENAGSSALDVMVHSGWTVDPKRMERVVLSFRQQGGKILEQRLIQPGQMPQGSKVYDGSEMPDGEWRLLGAKNGAVLFNRFPKNQVWRCFAEWSGEAKNRVTMDLWSAKRTLGPGEVLKMEADYGIADPKR
jgi:hypothetical protein